ncbi:MAG TPA: CAP domain-containing protein [Stenomitos sp.]
MKFPFRPFPFLALTLMGGLALASGCGTIPQGMLPADQTPAITNPGNVTPGAPSDWRVPSTPIQTPAPGTSPTTSPVDTPAPVATPAPASSDLASLEDYILQQCNVERAKVGAKALAMEEATLRPLARSRSQDMAVRNYFDHTTPDGKKVFDMLNELGYPYSTAGENIAMNTYPVSTSAQEAFKAWMNSSGHKANILNTKYGRIGVGAYRRSSDGAIYFTQVFTN